MSDTLSSIELLQMTERSGVVGNMNELLRAVEDRGGWEAVLAEWEALGGRAAAFADVWALSLVLHIESETFAKFMQVDAGLVRGFAESVQGWAVSERADLAEEALCKLTASLAGAYEEMQTGELGDEAVSLAAFWRERSDGFARGSLRPA